MKVAELREGMLVSPAGDNEIFVRMDSSRYKYPFLTVRTKKFSSWSTYSFKTGCDVAMYIGCKKDLKISKEDIQWSDRFVMWAGEIAAVDPASWARMKEC
tara:strand:- start:478 stop:777 length:300 start_codon:yes stop_codon:yes gene_type:complete